MIFIVKMRKFLFCGLAWVLLMQLLANGVAMQQRRLGEGNSSFTRKVRLCNLLCSLNVNRGGSNETVCYRIPAQNSVVTDCVFRCLRSKGESPIAEECVCRNGVCIEQPTTTNPATVAPTSRPQRPITTVRPQGYKIRGSPTSQKQGSSNRNRPKSRA